jgi:hypothetical protein
MVLLLHPPIAGITGAYNHNRLGNALKLRGLILGLYSLIICSYLENR